MDECSKIVVYIMQISLLERRHVIYNYIVSSGDISNNRVVLLKCCHGDVVP